MKTVTTLAVLLALPAFLTALAGDSVPQFISAAVADTSRPLARKAWWISEVET